MNNSFHDYVIHYVRLYNDNSNPLPLSSDVAVSKYIDSASTPQKLTTISRRVGTALILSSIDKKLAASRPKVANNLQAYSRGSQYKPPGVHIIYLTHT